MKKTMQERVSLLLKAREYAEKMQNGSIHTMDLKAIKLIEELIMAYQELVSENLYLEERLKSSNAFKKKRK